MYITIHNHNNWFYMALHTTKTMVCNWKIWKYYHKFGSANHMSSIQHGQPIFLITSSNEIKTSMIKASGRSVILPNYQCQCQYLMANVYWQTVRWPSNHFNCKDSIVHITVSIAFSLIYSKKNINIFYYLLCTVLFSIIQFQLSNFHWQSNFHIPSNFYCSI